MKVTWEPTDIHCGRVVGINGVNGVKEKCMIGYIPTFESLHMYVLISLSDGMVICTPTSRTEIAKQLNASNYLPLELLDKQ